MITRMTPENAGILIEGFHGQYGIARMVIRARDHGYEDQEIISAAVSKLAEMHPRDFDSEITDEQEELLMNSADEVETWLNEFVAPEGYQFGWVEGEFFLQEDFWWDDDIYDDEEDYEPETNGVDDFECYYYDALDYFDIEYDV